MLVVSQSIVVCNIHPKESSSHPECILTVGILCYGWESGLGLSIWVVQAQQFSMCRSGLYGSFRAQLEVASYRFWGWTHKDAILWWPAWCELSTILGKWGKWRAV